MPLHVDGPRPAVEWVTSLPRTWLLQADRHVLLAMALDTYDQHEPFTCRPGTARLWEWTGDASKGTLLARLDRLAHPTHVRPALLEVVEPARGTKATLYRLRTEVRSGLADRTTSSGPADRTASDEPDETERSDQRSDLRSVRSDHPFPTHLPPPTSTSDAQRARAIDEARRAIDEARRRSSS